MSRFISEDSVIDYDRDLVPDALEQELGLSVGGFHSDPEDSDGDGLLDSVEVQQGSDPSNGNDTFASAGSFQATAETLIPVNFTVGDHSGSHSEQWELKIYNVTPSGEVLKTRVQAGLGVLASREISFPEGFRQRVELNHVQGQGDFDYTFKIAVGAAAPDGIGLVVEDPDGLLGVNDNVPEAETEGDVTITVPKVRLKAQQGESVAINLGSATRTGIYFEAAPLVGPGTFKLTQNNDKIKVWSSETNGTVLTQASSKTKSWSLNNSQLGTLNATNRIWIEGLKVSDDITDTTVSLQCFDESDNSVGNPAEVAVTVSEISFERFVPQLDPVPAGYITEWIGRTPFDTTDYRGNHENTVLIEWNIPPDLAEELMPDISFRVVNVNPEPIRTLESEVFINDAEFRATDGVAPIRIIADFESKTGICQVDNPEERILTVGIFFKEQMLDFVNTIKILPRHRYLMEQSYPEAERFDRAAVYNALKYDLNFGYLPTHDPFMQGANGITQTFLTSPFIRVFIGPEPIGNENTLASTRIHENVHYKQGFTAIGEASAGHDFFFSWAGISEFDDITPSLISSLDFTSLSEINKASIQVWVGYEIDAYVVQIDADNIGITCLPNDKRQKAEDSIETYQSILFELL